MSFAGSFKTAPGTSSTAGAAFNVLCTVVGTGLLNLPYGASQSGWMGVLFLTILCFMAMYTADVLIKCLPLMENSRLLHRAEGHFGLPEPEPSLGLRDPEALRMPHDTAYGLSVPRSFGEIGEAAFGAVGRWAVVVQMHLTLTMVATIYVLLSGLNVVQLMGWDESQFPKAVLVVSCVVWLHVFLKTLSEVAVVSWFNICLTFVLEAVVIISALTNPPAEQPHTTVLVTKVSALGGAFASFAFAYGVHPVLPTVYRNMKNPGQYRPMIIISFLGVLALYLPMMIVGYYVYGDAVVSPIYNVPSLKTLPVVNVIVAVITVHCMASYAIIINPPERALESTLGVDDWKFSLLWRMLLRTGFVALTATVSITLGIKNFAPFLDLVAAFTSTFTQFIFPCMFYLKLARQGGVHISVVEYLWNFLIIVVAVIGAVFGTIQAVNEIAGVFN